MVYPSGSITTEIVSCKEGIVLMKATVTDEDKNIIGTGYAYEKEQSSNVNKTSYIENCETSAVGRALGMCGFGIDTSVASADEVASAIEEQESEPKKAEPKKEATKTESKQEDVANSPATQQQVTRIVNLYGSDPENFKRMLEYYKVTTIEDLTVLQASQAIEKAQARGERHE